MSIFASRGSGHDVAERLLHRADTYALLLWQTVVANAAALSARGPFGSGQWLGSDVPPNLVLPG